MTEERGLAIIEAPTAEPSGIYVDREAIECARINSLIKKRTAKAEAEQHKAERINRRTEKAAARRKAYNIATVKYILIRGGIIGAVAWAGMAGMIHLAICIPVGLFCLCAACLRLGKWLGSRREKELV